jgi:hypothetical protein
LSLWGKICSYAETFTNTILNSAKDPLSNLESIYLVYSLTTQGATRKTSLQEKLQILGLKALPAPTLAPFKENTSLPSFIFIIGFFLGDGTLLMRFRLEGGHLQLIPLFTIAQRNTHQNYYLMDLIVKVLDNQGIKHN